LEQQKQDHDKLASFDVAILEADHKQASAERGKHTSFELKSLEPTAFQFGLIELVAELRVECIREQQRQVANPSRKRAEFRHIFPGVALCRDEIDTENHDS
jgi:hypothetical protein